MSSRKREATAQLTRDEDDDDCRDPRAVEEFAVTPQIADAAELATRRMVYAKRPATAAAPAPAAGGFFKGVAAAPTAPAFGFGAKKEEPTKVPPTNFGFGAPAAPSAPEETGKKDEGEKAKPAAPNFSFGAPTSGEAPKFSFNFGAPVTGGAPSASGAPTPSFGFGFGAKAPANAAAQKADGSEPPKAAEPGKFVFGASSGFNFAANVASFADAQKKLTEEREAKAKGGDAAADADGADGEDKETGDDAPKTLPSASSIVALSGEVLANGPGKLYIFEKEGNKWKEHGEGDAKVKKDAVSAGEGEDDKKEKTVYRLMVRDGYSLNAIISKKAFVLSKEAEKHIIFSVATEAGVETYLLKFTGVTAESASKKVAEEIKKAIEATE